MQIAAEPVTDPGRPFVHNRVQSVLIHIPWYTIEGYHRLAQDCGVSPSTISRLCRGETASPPFYLAEKVRQALEKRLGVPLPISELFSIDGTYPTAKSCDLSPTCNGCRPPWAYDAEDEMRPEYRSQQASDWCRYPKSRTPAPDRDTNRTLTKTHHDPV